jgi:hypothetical protein
MTQWEGWADNAWQADGEQPNERGGEGGVGGGQQQQGTRADGGQSKVGGWHMVTASNGMATDSNCNW